MHGARVHRPHRKNATARSARVPYLRQGMRMERGWIGIDPSGSCPGPRDVARGRSEWGGVLDEQLWLAMYRYGVKKSGYHPKIGSYMGPDEALRAIKGAINGVAISKGSGPFPRPAGRVASDDVVGADVDSRTAWDSGNGTFSPIAGCATEYAVRKGLGPPFDVDFSPAEELGGVLCPLVMRQRDTQSAKDREAMDKAVHGFIDTETLVPWPAECGLPTVVTPVEVVWQQGENGEKGRLITDYRGMNAASIAGELDLPSVVSIAKRVTPKTRLAKQDCRAAFHQMRMRVKDRHLCAIIWRGKLYAFTACSFGVRNAPSSQMDRAQVIADRMAETLKVAFAVVYVDDFIEDIGEEEEDNIVSFISDYGYIMGKKKIEPASPVQEVLGLVVDAVKGAIYAPASKLKKARSMFTSFVETDPNSLQLAGLLGLLCSLEPAIPMLLLFTRPLYDDLKDALVGGRVVGRDDELPMLLRERDKSAYAWSVCRVSLSAESKAMLVWLDENIEKINGQSLTKMQISLLAKSDASERGFGGTLAALEKSGAFSQDHNIISLSGSLPDEYIESSSLDREAYGLSQTIIACPDHLLEGATIAAGNDNMALKSRYWMGTRSRLANAALIRMAKVLVSKGATLQVLYWMPRAMMDREDALSRKVLAEIVVPCVDVGWFRDWCLRLEVGERPNIDAFATRENAVLDRFVTLDISGSHFDGASVSWVVGDVPWFFPPLGSIKPAFRNWRLSASMVSYWCFPRIKYGGWWKMVTSQDDLSLEVMVHDVPASSFSSEHKFVLVRFRKSSTVGDVVVEKLPFDKWGCKKK